MVILTAAILVSIWMFSPWRIAVLACSAASSACLVAAALSFKLEAVPSYRSCELYPTYEAESPLPLRVYLCKGLVLDRGCFV